MGDGIDIHRCNLRGRRCQVRLRDHWRGLLLLLGRERIGHRALDGLELVFTEHRHLSNTLIIIW